MVFIYKLCITEIQIQPPGEPWEQHLGEVQQGMSKLKFNMDPISLFINLILRLFNCRCQVSDLDPDHWLLRRPCSTWHRALVYKPNCDLVSSLSINQLSAKYTYKNLYLLVVRVWARYWIIPRVLNGSEYALECNPRGGGGPPVCKKSKKKCQNSPVKLKMLTFSAMT